MIVGGTGTTGGQIIPPGQSVVIPGTPGSPGGPATTNPSGTQAQNASLSLPGLTSVPKFLIIGALLLAAAIGWIMQAAGGLLLGDSRMCRLGLTTGVPDLRKG